MRATSPIRLLAALTTLGFLGLPAKAQWTTQTLTLRPGWNAVYLEIQPEPQDCDSLFAGVPVEGAWAWNKRFSSVQFIQEPDELVRGQPDWLTYVPPAHPFRASQNLFLLEGGGAYLIRLATNASPVTWTLRGRPVIPSPAWVPDSLNFVGFPVQAASPPTFQAFFAASPAHAGKPIYRLNTLGHWEKVAYPASATLQPGEAFWVRCDGPSSYTGPLQVLLQQRAGLNYGRSMMEQPVSIVNRSSSPKTFVVQPLPSAPAPGTLPAVAGPVPVSYYQAIQAGEPSRWVPLEGPVSQTNIAPGEAWSLRVEVRRRDMAPSSATLYQSLLEVTDGAGSRLLIPVSAYPLQYAAKDGDLGPQGETHPYAGLWVGSAVLDKVSQPTANTDPVPAGSEFPFRLIVHVNTNGEPTLLRQVLLAWREAVTTNDDNGFLVVLEPRRTCLLTDEALLTSLLGSDPVPKTRRITSAAFGFTNSEPMAVVGDFGVSNSIVTCTTTLAFTNALNPFLHRYNPDHDNKDAQWNDLNESDAQVRGESYTITRAITLKCGSTNLVELPLAGAGDSHLGGDYSEIISGLHKLDLHLAGTFRLQRVSHIGVLNELSP